LVVIIHCPTPPHHIHTYILVYTSVRTLRPKNKPINQSINPVQLPNNFPLQLFYFRVLGKIRTQALPNEPHYNNYQYSTYITVGNQTLLYSTAITSSCSFLPFASSFLPLASPASLPHSSHSNQTQPTNKQTNNRTYCYEATRRRATRPTHTRLPV
jgi:hypothetical protein